MPDNSPNLTTSAENPQQIASCGDLLARYAAAFAKAREKH